MNPQLKLITMAFDALDGVFYSKTTNWAEKLREQCLKEEKEHRRFISPPSFDRCHPQAATANQCAKMFAVRWVAKYLLAPDNPEAAKFPVGQAYLHTLKSCFIAAGIADEYGEQIRAAWQGFNKGDLAALDYCKLVKPPEPKREAV